MKKIFQTALLLAGLFSAQVSQAQVSFMHAIGGSFYLAGSSGSGGGIMYSPRLNFLQLSDEMTVSAGSHIGLGFSGTANSQTGGNGSILIDLPVVAEFNIGHAASTDASSSFGGFLGIGYGYNKMAYSETNSLGISSAGSVSANGFLVNGGIRALINERPLGLRVSYLINSKSGGENILGLGLFYTLGVE